MTKKMKAKQTKYKSHTFYLEEDEFRKLKAKLSLLGKPISLWLREAINNFLKY